MTIHTYPNQKPWISGNIRTELKGRSAAFEERDSNPDAYKKSHYAFELIIKLAKRQYRTKTESYYTGFDARRMWHGLQNITDNKGKLSCELPSDMSLPDPINYFSARQCFKQATIVNVPKNTKVTCLNNYRPVALTSVAMKYFERLGMAYINTIIPETLNPLQFAYHPNRSTDDAISIALHTALSHLDKRNTYLRLLFIDYNSAPSKLITKLRTLRLNTSLCNCILDFLTCLPQVVG